MQDQAVAEGNTRQWYALRAKCRRESGAATLLAQAGIEVYVPELQVRSNPYRPPSVEPLFPGYLFGRLNPLRGDLHLANRTPGIIYVVGFGGEPLPVPDDIILAIQRRLARHGGLDADGYRPGERVVITTGPLRNVEAVFDRRLSANGRVRLLVRILQRVCGVEVREGQFRRAGEAAGVA